MIRKYLYAGLGILALGTLSYTHYVAYKAGSNKAKVECQSNTLNSINKALDEQAKNHLKNLKRAIERDKSDRVIEKQIEKVYVEIPKVVHKTVLAKPQCPALGLDILRVWNKPISGTHYYREGDKAKATTPPVNPLSATDRSYKF